MPRGFPDDNIQSFPLGQTIADNAELAARLGSVSTMQRSGQVIYFTQFAQGVSDWYTYYGDGGYVKVKANGGLYGPTRLELLPGLPGGPSVGLFKYLPMLDGSNVGFEISIDFEYEVLHSDYEFDWTTLIDWHGVEHLYHVSFYPDRQQIRIRDWVPGTGYVDRYIDIPSQMWSTGYPYNWHYAKYVVSPELDKFKRLYWDDYAYDISMYGCFTGPLALTGQIQEYLRPDNSLNPTKIEIGHAIVTINEP